MSDVQKITTSKALLAMLEETEPITLRVRTATFSLEAKVNLALELSKTAKEVESVIDSLRSSDAGHLANEWFAAQVYIESLISELRMWIEISSNNADAAWGYFCSAEVDAKVALRFLRTFGPAQRQVVHIGEVERVVFPHQPLFLSSAIFVAPGGAICTICEQEYGECEHIKGEIYDGRFAQRKIVETVGVREVSLVEKPDSKRCRILAVAGLDPLTGLPSKRVTPHKAKISTMKMKKSKIKRYGK